MRALPVLLALPLVLAAIAGCVESAKDAKPAGGGAGGAGLVADPWPAVQAKMAGVPCDSAVGGDTSPNLIQLSNITYGDEAGIHGEVDIRGHIALHARYQAGGFEVIDIADPLHPLDLGAYDYNGEQDGDALDVKFSPDNSTALVGLGSGIIMADVRDPHHPVTVGQWNFTDAKVMTDPAPRFGQNAHMFYTARIGSTDWVFLAPNSNTGVWMLKLEGTPDHRKLTYVSQTLPVQGGPIGPHDIYVAKDEKDGHWYLYSADGFHGWSVFNVDDPTKPSFAGGIVNPAEAAYTHTVQAQWVNGHRLVASIGEIGANILKVYDATNLMAPLLLGVFQASPGQYSAASEHNFNIVAGKLYLSYYNYGMYIFDLAKLTAVPVVGTLDMQPVGHYGNNKEDGSGGTVDIWDTIIKDGILYLSDIEGGLVVLGYGCNHAPDPMLTSTG